MGEKRTGEIPLTKSEVEQKPQILYRAFTVDPRSLTLESLNQPLVPGTSAEYDSTRMADGNERGVYMSTNRTMVEAAYAHTSRGLFIPSPRFSDNGLVVDKITLPQCGVIVEVNTNNLPIRKPNIIPVLQGHYNNGFAGDEYIVEVVPPENYKIIRLVLSRWANDNEQFIIDISDTEQEKLKLALKRIQTEFTSREQSAKEFLIFLNTLDPHLRLNDFNVKRKWQQYRKAKNP